MVSKYGMPTAEDTLFETLGDEAKAVVMAQIRDVAEKVQAARLDLVAYADNLVPFVIEHIERQGYKVKQQSHSSDDPRKRVYRITW